MIFSLQPYTFATEKAKVVYVIGNLTGKALLCGDGRMGETDSGLRFFLGFLRGASQGFLV